MRVETPNGWAELADPQDVTERKRGPLVDLMFQATGMDLEAESPGPEAVRLMLQANYAVIAAMVTSWSFDLPITVDGVMDLPGRDFAALKDATKGRMKDLLPDFGVDPAPDSPTGASSD